VKAQVIWTPLALSDMEEVPASVGQRIIKQVEQLKTFPNMGSPLTLPEAQMYRQLIVPPYRVIHRHDEEARTVYILHVLHTRRDWTVLLRR